MYVLSIKTGRHEMRSYDTHNPRDLCPRHRTQCHDHGETHSWQEEYYSRPSVSYGERIPGMEIRLPGTSSISPTTLPYSGHVCQSQECSPPQVRILEAGGSSTVDRRFFPIMDRGTTLYIPTTGITATHITQDIRGTIAKSNDHRTVLAEPDILSTSDGDDSHPTS